MSRTSNRTRLHLETLEGRLTPASTRLLLDFTPEEGVRAPRGRAGRGSFADVFHRANPDGSFPHFLDFSGDGQLTRDDMRLAAQAIVERTRDYFRPYLPLGVRLDGVDLEGNTGRGKRAVRLGRLSAERQVFVLFLGGEGSSEGPNTILGEASELAGRGFNHEGHGWVYTDSIALAFFRGAPDAPPERFAQVVASTTAHEFGHLLGLGHPRDPLANSDTVMNHVRRPGQDSFVNRSYLADRFLLHPRGFRLSGLAMQNPHAELVRSFRGQPDQSVFLDPPSGRPAQASFGGPNHAHPSLAPPAVDRVFSTWDGLDELPPLKR